MHHDFSSLEDLVARHLGTQHWAVLGSPATSLTFSGLNANPH